jgi:hypothetical protein
MGARVSLELLYLQRLGRRLSRRTDCAELQAQKKKDAPKSASFF